jgi:Na+/glutamate symporter
VVFWQRFLATLLAIVCVSLLAGYLSEKWLDFQLPSYVSGVIGGIAALPVWELLRNLRPKQTPDNRPPA